MTLENVQDPSIWNGEALNVLPFLKEAVIASDPEF